MAAAHEPLPWDDAKAILELIGGGQDTVLVGGQAVAFWAAHFGLEESPLTTDIDLFGDRMAVLDADAALSGYPHRTYISGMDDMSPNSGKIAVDEGKTGRFPDPCVAVGPGVFPAVATLHRKPEGKHKANRHSVKPFVEPSGDARVPLGTKLYRPADERRACAGGVLAKVVAKFLTPEIVLDPISGLLKIGDSPIF